MQPKFLCINTKPCKYITSFIIRLFPDYRFLTVTSCCRQSLPASTLHVMNHHTTLRNSSQFTVMSLNKRIRNGGKQMIENYHRSHNCPSSTQPTTTTALIPCLQTPISANGWTAGSIKRNCRNRLSARWPWYTPWVRGKGFDWACLSKKLFRSRKPVPCPYIESCITYSCLEMTFKDPDTFQTVASAAISVYIEAFVRMRPANRHV